MNNNSRIVRAQSTQNLLRSRLQNFCDNYAVLEVVGDRRSLKQSPGSWNFDKLNFNVNLIFTKGIYREEKRDWDSFWESENVRLTEKICYISFLYHSTTLSISFVKYSNF